MDGMTGAQGAPQQGLAVDLGLAGVSAGVSLFERRSRALAEYWRTLAAVREPSELVGVQYGYFTRMVEDYANAWTACFAPLASGGPDDGERARAPQQSASPPQTAQAA